MPAPHPPLKHSGLQFSKSLPTSFDSVEMEKDMVQGIKDGRQENSSQMRENPPLGSGIPIPLIELESGEHRTFFML